jgi:two-component system, cell cycle sensor histidine kinase and response regulator CckA
MRETILVVDDEPFVLRALSNILTRARYRVLPADSPREALRIAANINGPIHLLLCDVVMPGLSGPSLAERFEELHPDTPCIFMAGLPDSPEVYDRILSRGRDFLAKPFLPGVLLAKVREVLAPGQARVA